MDQKIIQVFHQLLDQHTTSDDVITQQFHRIIWDYFRIHARPFPWRDSDDPYHIVVSEIMLQQTQTHRVIEKYHQFLRTFPTFRELAQAPKDKLLTTWSGLGYNRRALYLQRIAQEVVTTFHGRLPQNPKILETLPGIGPNTAGSIAAFAFNLPTVFIETNIRTVFLHFFFHDQHGVHDKQLMPIITQTIDTAHPRHWYYALMDYGVMLKRHLPNPNRKSKHYTKQSRFEGSNRQVRSMILQHLLKHKSGTIAGIAHAIQKPTVHVEKNCHAMTKEGLLEHQDTQFLWCNFNQEPSVRFFLHHSCSLYSNYISLA